MAPQNKRTAGASKANVAAKKAKVAPTHEIEDPRALQLAPVLAALEASELPADCCEIFRAALPHCIADVSTDRHGFQTKMLDLAVSSLKRSEEVARAALKEAETKAADSQAEGTVTTADFEAAQLLATSKKSESEAKCAEVEKLKSEREAAKSEVANQIQAKEAFFESKTALIAEEEAFQKVLIELWEPLKTYTFQGAQWRKRDKFVAELVEKVVPLNLDASLVEALQAAMGLRKDQRGGFALKAFAAAEEAFEKHKALLAERVAGTAVDEEVRARAVTEAEAKSAEAQEKHSAQDKESDDLQNAWAELETNSNKAESSATTCQNDIQDALLQVEARKTELDAALAVAASFAEMMDPPPPMLASPTAAVLEDVVVDSSVPVDANMDVEVEAVAVGAC